MKGSEFIWERRWRGPGGYRGSGNCNQDTLREKNKTIFNKMKKNGTMHKVGWSWGDLGGEIWEELKGRRVGGDYD